MMIYFIVIAEVLWPKSSNLMQMMSRGLVIKNEVWNNTHYYLGKCWPCAFKSRIDTALIRAIKETNYCWNLSEGNLRPVTSSRGMSVKQWFLIICTISGSIRRIDAMTKVLIKSEWWNFSVHYINLNDVQFYPLYTMEWNGTRRIALTFPHFMLLFYKIDTFHFAGISNNGTGTFTCTNRMRVVTDTYTTIVVRKGGCQEEEFINQLKLDSIWFLHD